MLELVQLGCHRRDVAEVAIKTFKAHFIAILAGSPQSFPIKLWSELLPQAELTLTILCPSHARPNVSTHTYLFGQFDFNKNPLVPIGSERCNVMSNQEIEAHGLNTRKMDGSWAVPCPTTVHFVVTSIQPRRAECMTLCSLCTITSRNLPSHQETP